MQRIVSHLSVGDVFRMQRVTARDEVWKDKEVLRRHRRAGDCKTDTNHSISALRRRMAKTAGRCRECAAKDAASSVLKADCSPIHGFAPGRAYLYWFSDVKRFLKTH